MARLLGRLLRHDVQVKIDGVNSEGDLTFRIPYSELKCQQTDVLMIPYLRSRFFSNVLADIVLRRNGGQFTDLLTYVPPSLYRDTVRKYQNHACGMWVERFELRIQCNLSLLHEVINEELAEVIRASQ